MVRSTTQTRHDLGAVVGDEQHDTIDFLINVALGTALLVGGCAAIILVIAVANGILNLVGRI
jgi:hypothetical protein